MSGRFFPDVIESFDSGSITGHTLFHKFQELYSAGQQTPNVEIRTWPHGQTKIDVIVADPRLSAVTVDKLPNSNNIQSNNRLLLQHLQVIKYGLDHVKHNYDYIMIDSHPEVSDILRSVIYASHYCVSPVKLDRQSSIGVATIIGEINNVNADVEMIQHSVDDFEYVDTIFAGSIGMMAREYGGALKQTEYDRLRRTGGGCSSIMLRKAMGCGKRLPKEFQYLIYKYLMPRNKPINS